jgi:hypothetical protein
MMVFVNGCTMRVPFIWTGMGTIAHNNAYTLERETEREREREGTGIKPIFFYKDASISKTRVLSRSCFGAFLYRHCQLQSSMCMGKLFVLPKRKRGIGAPCQEKVPPPFKKKKKKKRDRKVARFFCCEFHLRVNIYFGMLHVPIARPLPSP